MSQIQICPKCGEVGAMGYGECRGPREGSFAAPPCYAAIRSAAKMLLDHYESRRCDNEAVSDCLRCSSVFLAKEALKNLRDSERMDWLETGSTDGEVVEYSSGRITRKSLDAVMPPNISSTQ